jgi:alpha/beta superfamily hydrolase
MHNKVVYHAAKVFSSLGWPVLRFNFRGTGLSEGKHHGRHEVEDVTAGLDWLSREYGKPIVAAGFSFGAAIGLEACGRYKSPEGTSEIKGFAALGLPTQAAGRDYTYPFLPSCTFPKLFLSGDHDQFSPVNLLRSVVETAPSPTSFELIPDADHFFVGHLPAMQATLGNWLRTTFLLTAQPEKSQP